ncbi:MAG: hypothetical protein IAE67_02090 [Candidatus Competibacteraceae bacterium]|nr:hypothetical protein [Candidatus Competibacteraceae bacterium]
MRIYLTGYQPRFFFKSKHTNWWPWNYLAETFKLLGYDAYHMNMNRIDRSRPAVYICWNAPDSISLIDQYGIHPDSIVVQKLTSFDGSPESANTNWTERPIDFFKGWHWPQYQKLNVLHEKWPKFYAFGALTDVNSFPEKKKIVDKFKERIFWIPWGTMTVPYNQIMQSRPLMNGFKYDAGFVGSRWGTKMRGNITEWDAFLQPLLNQASSYYLAGKGTPKGPVSVKEHVAALQQSRLCPIIHATSWKVEKGIMDRFWTVFSLGRFGVVDNEGILSFFNTDEVVLETNPDEYVAKSLYYMKNPDKQLPFIEKVLTRIQKEYNQKEVWSKILKRIFAENGLKS